MQSTPRRARFRRSALTALALGLTCASTGALAPSASASFALDRCEGDIEIKGRGASFQTPAHNAFRPAFTSNAAPGCNGHEAPAYNSNLSIPGTGSGNGRGAMGTGEGSAGTPMAVVGNRDPEVRYSGTDEGLSAPQQNTVNNGTPGNTNDDGLIRHVPIAASSIPILVNYPSYDGNPDPGVTANTICPLPGSYDTGAAAAFNRMRVPNWKLERAMAGADDMNTWGELLEDYDDGGSGFDGIDTLGPAATGDPATDLTAEYAAGCVDRKIIRVVRQDISGTSYAVKDFLTFAADINDNTEAPADPETGDGTGTDWKPEYTNPAGPQGANANRKWPNTTPDASGDAEAAGQLPELGETAGGNGGTNVCDPTYVTAAPSPVCHSASTGNPGVAAVVTANSGSIGYADLPTARANGFQKADAADTTYMLPLALRASKSEFVEPVVSPTGVQQGQSTGGSPCNVAIRDVPAGADPTTGAGWDETSMVYPSAGYGLCTLTYVLAWDDNAPVYVSGKGGDYDTEERLARAVKDYLAFIVSDLGQGGLGSADYSPLPQDVQTLAETAVARIDWDDDNIGGRDTGTGTNTNTGGGGGGGGGTSNPGTTTPPPAPPVAPPANTPGAPTNAFVIPSARTRGTDILASFRLPGPGRLVVTATGRYTERVKVRRRGRKARTVSRRRTVSVARATVNVTRAGDLAVRLPQSSAARRGLRRTARMAVTITAVYTPTGGQPRTVTRALTLRGRR